MQIIYFAQDLSDAAVARRVRMLLAGGAEVKLFGFRRSAEPIGAVEGVPAVDLGRTFDGKLASRFVLVLRRSLEASRTVGDIIASADVVLARNLEMATIADAARGSSRVPLVYECLDIHGSQLGGGMRSKLLRRWETRLLRRCAALITSSQRFIDNYFNTLGIDLPPVILAENKRVLVEGPINRPQSLIAGKRPWKIGWFGNIRCVKSFYILSDLAQKRPDLVEIDIRGRPTQVLQDLIDEHLPLPNMRFGGSYGPDDLASLYQSVHMTWAVDYKDVNSDWLLPNRLYEGNFYNRPLIALDNTETATWLRTRRAGVLMGDPSSEIEPFIDRLTMADYDNLQQASGDIPTADLVWTRENCRQFVRRLQFERFSESFSSTCIRV